MNKRHLTSPLGILLALLVVNILSCLFFLRLDATTNQQHSLSPVSKTIIADIGADVTVTLYMSEGLTHEEYRLGKEFLYLLREYKSLHRGRFTINVITVDTEEEQLAALQQGIELVTRETAHLDRVQLRSILFGATIRVGDHHTVIPRVRPFTPLEYEITRTLKLNHETERPLVGFLVGHGETDPDNLSRVIREIAPVANIERVYLHPYLDLERYKVLCIIGPVDTFSPLELALLDDYAQRGGRLFIALDHAVGKLGLTPTYGFINRVGIEEWLERLGLRIRYDFIVDRSSNIVSLTRAPGFFSSYTRRFHFPYAPVIIDFNCHLITDKLRAISLEYASSIEKIPTATDYTFTWLAKSSSMSGVKEIPVILNPLRTLTAHDYNKPGRTVSALLDNKTTGSAIVTITDADFMHDNFRSPAYDDNTLFAVNAIEWLVDDSGLINLRNKYVTRHPIAPVSAPTRTFLRYANLLFPLLLLGSLFLWKYQSARRKRLRRMYSSEL
jgi:ABC-type uncharacterized transport system involved in gliding motility auxiliary subunit